MNAEIGADIYIIELWKPMWSEFAFAFAIEFEHKCNRNASMSSLIYSLGSSEIVFEWNLQAVLNWRNFKCWDFLLKTMVIIWFCFLLVSLCRMSVLRTLTLLTIGATIALAQRRLALPDPRSCANRKYMVFSHFWNIPIKIWTKTEKQKKKHAGAPSFFLLCV